MTYSDDSDSFLGDDLGLPKELKRAQARRLLYGPMAQSQKEQSEVKVQKETEDSMLLRFLKSLPETDKPDPKPVGSNDFEQIFGQAPSFAVEKKQPCFALDAQQVTMLKRFWQCPRPQKMGAFSEESHKILKVQDDFLQHIQVPPLDDFVKMVNQRAGLTTKEGYRAKLWQNLEYDVRRIQKGGRVGFLADALSQKIMFRLGELLKSWQSDGTLDAAKFNEAHQLLLGAFDATNCGLEQSARVGGLVHQTRRKIVLEDLQIPVKKRDVWLSQGLASEGIMGAEFAKQLEDMDKMSKAMRASARHLGLLSQGQKRPGQGEMQAPPPKRPFRPRQAEGTQHFYSPYSTEYQRGRGRGRGRGQRGHPTGGRGRGRGTTTTPPDPAQFWRQTGEYNDPIHTLSARTCGRSIDSFSPAVAADHHRFVGARDYWRWLCTRFCAKSTSIFGYSKNESFKSDPVKHYAEGGQFSVGEKCCATSADKRGTRGLLQHNVLVPKKNSMKLRPVINLKPLNRYMQKMSFKMDHLKIVLSTLKPQFWGVSIDLSDAYFHIPIRPSHWKFLRFSIAGQILEFKALPFGPTTAPRVFTKVVSAIVQFLRTNGVWVLTYLDDWLLYSPSHSKLLQARDYVLKVITWLGFIPNLEKSDFIPTQDFVFIGARFKLNQGLAAVPEDRFLKLSLAIQEVLSQKSTASAYQILRILGLMASVLQLVQWGRLHMRPIQLYLLHFWKPSKRQIQDQGGLCARRIQSELGEFKCICIPSNLSHSSSTGTDGVSSMSGNSDCTIVAQTGMVHEASGSAGRYSHNTTDSRQSAAAGQRAQQHISSQPTNVVLDGMETVQPQGSSGNLSERAKDLVEASLREGTRKDYLSKYGRYSDWCDQRGSHPSRAPLNEILNFLAHLQEQGYSYSTVCGYRSMLSAFHEPVDGDSVGSHPSVTRLIKGVFNTNPPNKKLCPEWVVGVVLKYLSGEPFIPFESCSLKFLTMKACFLLAITSARRADDISKLSMMPGQCRFMKDKLLLIPDDLLKQDRPSHYLSPLEIERYDNLNICAVHTLEKYLQVVENLRGQMSSLFLTVIRPHKKPASQTISRWITEVIRLAYEKAGKPLAKINAHSTRGMATSWA